MKNPSVNYLKIGQAAKALGVSIDTLRRWERNGKITAIRTPGGTRLYSLSALKKVNPVSVEDFQAKSLSTEELLKKTRNDSEILGKLDSQTFRYSDLSDYSDTPSSSEFSEKKVSLVSKLLVGTAVLSIITLLLTSWIAASYVTQPKATQQFFKNNVASGLFLPFHKLAEEAVAVIDPRKARELGFTPPDEPPPILYTLNPKPSSNVLAVTASPRFLEVNSDTQINGSLSVRDSINGLSLEATPSANIFALTSGNTTLTVTKTAKLDQDVSTAASPTFNTLNLSATKNQLVFESGGPSGTTSLSGTLTWTPTAAQTITLPDATGTVVLDTASQTITNKTISGSSNTITNISNSALANSKVTVTAGTNLTGGGDITLGSSATISLKDSVSLSGTLTVSGATTLSSTLAVTGATTLSSTLTAGGVVQLADGTAAAPALTFTNDTDTGLYRISANKIGLITGGSATSGITIDGSGNVGVGNISPSYTLDVTGRVNGATALCINGDCKTAWSGSGSYTASNGLTLTGVDFQLGGSLTRATGIDIASQNFGFLGNIGIGTSANSGARLSVMGGNVGIGTTSPAKPLTVVGDGSGRILRLISNTATVGDRSGLEFLNSSIDPTNWAAAITISDATTDGGLVLTTTSNSSYANISDIIFKTRDVEKMRITNNGNVGIGTSLPNSTLSIQGNVGIGFTGLNQSIPANGLAVFGNIGIGTTTANSNLSIVGNAHIGSIYQGITAPTNGLFVDGNVGIGATTSSNKLDVWGNTRLAGTLTVDSTSTFGGNLTLSSGQFLAPNGTSALPSYSFTNSTSTGMYSPSANALALVTNGASTPALTITAAGNVGIGTTMPLAPFHILTGTANFVVDSNGRVGINQTGPSAALDVNLGTTAGLNLAGRFRNSRAAAVGTGSYISFAESRTTGGITDIAGVGGIITNIGNSSYAGALVFMTANAAAAAEVARFDYNGNLGIGTTSPLSTLAAAGNIGIGVSYSWYAAPINGIAVQGNVGIGATTANSNLSIVGNAHIGSIYQGITAPTNGLFVDGNVGIGATTSSNKLDVWGTARITNGLTLEGLSSATATALCINSSNQVVQCSGSSALTGTGVNGGVTFWNGTSSLSNSVANFYWDSANNRLGIGTSAPSQSFQVNASTGSPVVITSDGNVGIGTTNPTRKLVVAGATSELQFYSDSNISTINSRSLGGTASRWLILNPGGDSVGIGTSNPGSKLSVGGNAAFGSTYSYLTAPTDGLLVEGNVGIGATTSSNKLDVWGNSRIAGTLTVDSTSTFGGNLTLNSGQFLAPNGTAILPSYSFSNSTGTGLWSPSANALSLTTNGSGTSGITVAANGNVGIGLTNPAALLHISNTSDALSTIRLSRSGSSNDWGVYRYGSSGSDRFCIGIYTVNEPFCISTGGNIGIGITTANSSLSVAGNAHIGSMYQGIVAPTNGLFVDGNVGIGATTSSNKLDVWGNQRITGTLTVDGSLTTGAQTINGNLLPGADNIYALGSTSLRWSSLHVGPGSVVVHNDATNTNWSKLDFAGSAAQLITDSSTPLQLVTGTNNLGLYLNTSGNVGIGTTNPDYTFRTQGTGYFSGFVGIGSSMNVSGNVGIGGTATVTSLAVLNGGLSLSGTLTQSSGVILTPNGSAGAPSYSFTNSSSTGMYSPSSNALALNTNGASTPPLTITAGGNVGIATTSPGEKLEIAGNIKPTTTNTYTAGTQTLSTTANTTYTGSATNRQLGVDLTSGDVNGDGYSDLIVGAPTAGGGTGNVYVYYGSASGPSSTISVTLAPGSAGDDFGYSVATADVNGDGYQDIIVGSSTANTNDGKAYIFYGSKTGPSTTPSVTINGASGTAERFGISVANAGDVNGDGYQDIVIGAYKNSTNKGKAYIFYGGPSGPGTTANVTITGTSNNDDLGFSVNSAGDINGDGYSDVVVGAYQNNTGNGKAYIFYGGPNLSSSIAAASADIILTGEAATNSFGETVGPAGDFNGDGYPDVVIGALWWSSSGTNKEGRAYVFYGGPNMSSSISAASANVIITGEAVSDNFSGRHIGNAGDINGDGYSDLLIGADTMGTSSGKAYIFYGGPNISSSINASAADIKFTGEQSGQSFGYSTAKAGDVNGDGYPDVIIGGYNYNDGLNTQAGRAYYYPGSGNRWKSVFAQNINLLRGLQIGNLSLDPWGLYTGKNAFEITTPDWTISRQGTASLQDLTVGGNIGIGIPNSSNAALAVMGGNVGIGASIPNAKLSIQGNVGIGYTGLNQVIPANGLAVSGNLGIGTTTANSNLSISGNAHIGGLFQGIAAPTDGLFVDGNVGIGATTSANKLDVWGNANVTGNLTVGGTLTQNGNISTSGVFLAANGSASAPSYSFTNLTNAGLWTNGNGLLLTTGGSNTSGITVTGAGNVGIGTTSPATQLAVGSNVYTGTGYGAGLGNVEFGGNGTGNLLVIHDHGATASLAGVGVNTYISRGTNTNPTASQANDILYWMGGRGYGTTAYGSNSKAVIAMYASQNWTDSNQGTYITFNTTPNNSTMRAEVLRIDQAGNVGIGLTTANSQLSISNNAHIGSLYQGTVAPTNGLFVDGNVGIGATTSVNKLDVWGNARVAGTLTVDSTLTVNSTATLGNALIGYSGVTAPANGLAVMGNIGIGTTTASQALDVIGAIALNHSTVLQQNTTLNNLFVGSQAGNTGTPATGQWNTFVGIGVGTTNAGNYNTFMGYQSGNSNITGINNSYFGYRSGYYNTTGVYNSFFGFQSGFNTSGNQNSFFGNQSGQGNTTGGNNSFFGFKTGISNTTGGNNTSLGYQSGYSNTSGSYNLFLGSNAGYNELGSNKLYIYSGSSTTARPLIYGDFSAGNVGIGTTAGTGLIPPARLTLNGAGDSTGLTFLTQGLSQTNFGLSVFDNGNVGIGTTAALASGTNFAVLGGNVGIGTTTANSNLSVAGSAHIGSIRQGIAAPTDGLFVDGNVGIGATTSSNKLDVWGNERIAGTLTIDSTSTFGGNLSLSSGQFLAPNGTNSLPSYSFTNSTSTGLWSPSANALSLTTNGSGTSGITIAANGNVGIGLTNPAALLHISNTSDALSTIRLSRSGSSNDWGVYRYGSSGSDRFCIGIYTVNEPFCISTGGNIGIGLTTANSQLSISNNAHIGSLYQGTVAPTNGLFVDGNVGIGATTSSNKLDVWGNTRMAGNLTVDGTLTQNGNISTSGVFLAANGSASTPSYSFTNSTSTGLWSPSANALSLTTNGSGTSGITIAANGNVGIGLTNPAQKLELSGNFLMSNNSPIMWWNSTSNSAKNIMKLDNNNIFQISNASSDIRFVQENFGTALMTIQNGGNVGIGFTSPDRITQLASDINITSSLSSLLGANGSQFSITGSTAANLQKKLTLGIDTTDNYGVIQAGNTSGTAYDLALNPGGGNVGIGTTSPTGRLEVVDTGGYSLLKYLPLDATPLSGGFGEWRINQTRAYSAATQAPLLDLIQNSTGEVTMRYMHADDTGTTNWLHGELGRKSDGTIFRDWVLWLDGQKVALTAKYATDSTAGRILVGTAFWDTTPAAARLEVRGSADEPQFLVQANGTQTNSILNVQSSSGSPYLTVAGGGNVGIGTTTPNSLLSVVGGAHIGGTYQGITAPTNGLFVDGNVGIGATTSSNKLDVWGNANITGNLTIGGTETAASISNGQFLAANGSASAPSYSFTNLNNAGLWTNGDGLLLTTGGSSTKGITVTGTGNIGIGTTSPIATLQIAGTGTFSTGTGAVSLNGTTTIAASRSLIFASGTGTYSQTFSGTTQTPWMLQTTHAPTAGGSQDVTSLTITNNPSTLSNSLNAADWSITESSNLANTINGLNITFTDAGTGTSTKNGLNINVATANPNDKTFAAILMGGNVGIGTSFPNSTLAIQGNIGIGYTGTNQVIPANGLAVFGNVGIGITTANSNFSVAGNAHIGNIFQGITAPTNGLFVDGNVGIGATTSSNKLDVWGNANITGNLTVGGTTTYGGNLTLSSGQFLAPNGTSALPSYSFTNSTSTGMYSPSANALALNTNGASTPPLTITAGGNVGIGTTSPSQTLEVAGNILLDASGNTINFTNNDADKILFLGLSTAAKIAHSSSWGFDSYAGNTANNGSGFFRWFTVTGSQFTEKMRLSNTGGLSLGNSYVSTDPGAGSIIASGNVGIGTASPVAQLDVRDTGTSTTLHTYIGSGAGQFGILDNGNVGVGTTNPATTFVVSTASSQNIFIAPNSSTLGAGVAVDYLGLRLAAGAGNLDSGQQLNLNYNGRDLTNSFQIKRGSALTPVLTADTNGNIGIGSLTTSPVAQLDVRDALSSTGLHMYVGSGAGQFGILDNGNVGIGTTSPSQAFQINSGSSSTVITSTGNIGIGTTNVGDNLVIGGSADNKGFTIYPYATSNYGYIRFSNGTSNNEVTDRKFEMGYSGDSGNFYLGEGGSQSRFAITSAGNIGIGTSLPLAVFQVNTSVSNPFVVQSGGNVGIGTTTPNSLLSVVGGAHIGGTYQGITAPTNGLFVDGNVGIGATTSSNKLDVWGNARVTGTLTVDGSTTFDGGNFSLAQGQFLAPDGTSSLPSYSFTNSTSTGLWSPSVNALSLTTNGSGTSGITITAGGNIGIGVTNPTSLIGIVGNSGQLGVQMERNTTSNTAGNNIIFGAGGATLLATNKAGGNLLLYAGTSTGNATSSIIFHVPTPGGSGTADRAPVPGMTLTGTGGGRLTIQGSSAALTFAGTTPSLTSSGSVFGIFAGGNVGIGTTGNLYGGLTVRGTGTTTNISLQTYGSNLTQGLTVLDSGNVGIGTTNPSTSLIVASGNVGIGFTSASQQLEVKGRIRMQTWTADGTTAVYYNSANGDIGVQASDVRLKTNITPIQNSLDIIKGINGVAFNWLTDGTGAQKTVGVIAQDVMKVMPELVYPITGPDGQSYYGVHYDKLGPVLIEGIKEQQTEIDNLITQQSSTSTLLAGLAVGSDGTLTVPKLKSDKLTLSADTNFTPDQLNNLQTVLSGAMTSSAAGGYNIDLLASLGSISEKILGTSTAESSTSAQLADLQTTVATQSSTLAGLQSAVTSQSATTQNLAQQLASSSAELAQAKTDIASLKLTPPDILLATGSATLANLNVTSEATISGQLTAYNLNIQNSFKSLGTTSLGTTLIAGDLTVDGTLSLTGNSLNSLDTLHIQNSSLAGPVDFFNGLVTIDNKGSVLAQTVSANNIVTNKLTISNTPVASSSASLQPIIGSGKLLAGQTKIAILANQITSASKVFLTPKSTTLGQTLFIETIEPGTGFVVSIDNPVSKDIDFDWWVVETQ